MYELQTKKGNLFLLFLIMLLVAFFTIIAYTIIIDNNQYKYESKLEGKPLLYQENETIRLEDILEEASESIVGISKIKNIGTTIFLENSTQNLNLGSGVIISKEGYILTNEHVAGDKYSTCYITLKNGVTDNGVVVWSNKDLDLAIIKINIKSLPVANLGDSNNVRLGNTVYAIGNPVGYELQRTVTSGIISGINRTIKIQEDNRQTYLEGLIQTDATINQGNSGGPLINKYGEVIAIATLKVEDAEGIGFAIPINIVKPIIQKLTQTGKFDEPYLGIIGYDKEAIPYLSSNINFETGIYIEQIDMAGPLKDSNLSRGDIVEKIDNIKIESMNQLKEYIYSKNIDDEITLIVNKKHTIVEVKARLAKMPWVSNYTGQNRTKLNIMLRCLR